MDNKIFVAVLVLVAIAGAFFLGGSNSKQGNDLGAVINYYSSLSNARLYTSLNSLLTDITAVRAPIAGLIQVSTSSNVAALNLGALGTTTSTASSTATATGAAAGDACIAGVTTPTVNVDVTCQVSGTNSVIFWYKNNQTPAQTMTTSTVTATVIPKASFVAAAALTTTATTTSTGL